MMDWYDELGLNKDEADQLLMIGHELEAAGINTTELVNVYLRYLKKHPIMVDVLLTINKNQVRSQIDTMLAKQK